MLRSYLRAGIRHLLRNKSDASINIGGLALGISIAILIGLWVNDELTYNEYHKNHGRVGQVYKNVAQKWLPYPLTTELKASYGHLFKHIVTADPAHDFIISSGDKVFNVRAQFVSMGLPEMLTLEMIQGDWSALNDPHSVILSESMAWSLFGNEDPIDKFARISNRMDVKVTGVYRDIPHNSEFAGIKFFAPWDLLELEFPALTRLGWDEHFVFVYTELAAGVTFEDVAPAIVDAEMNVIRNMDNMKREAAENPRIRVHPMDRWHLHSTFDPKVGAMSGGPIQFVYLVSAIGIFVLVLACINFMNLATARSEKRMREVGLRNSIGSLRSQLIAQFFSESFLVVVISFVLAIIIAAAALPALNQLTEKQMSMPWSNPVYWISAIVLVITTGLLSGSYPALYLSSFRPAIVLTRQNRIGSGASFMRRALVTVQFTVSISLIIATIFVYKQIVFVKDREVGYTRDGLIIVPGRAVNDRYDAIYNELMQTGVVKDVATAGGKVTSAWSQGGGFEWKGKAPDLNPTIGTLTVDHNFGRTVGWKIIAGRDFEEGMASDSSAFIINEAAAKAMGFDTPVGEVVHWKSKFHNNVDKDFTIIGVVSNLMMKSPYDDVMPAVFYLHKDFGAIHIRLFDPDTGHALAKIERVFRNIAPDMPFEYNFADVEYNRKFAYEERIGKLGAVFATLAIVISCLGLFGMASFMTERRTKEIGIRKVVGASVFSLWKLMSSEFMVLVILSWFIAAPISWYAISPWLENFAYRTSLSWEVFAVAGLGSLIVTILTVSFRLLEAANRNPVKSLRAE